MYPLYVPHRLTWTFLLFCDDPRMKRVKNRLELEEMLLVALNSRDDLHLGLPQIVRWKYWMHTPALNRGGSRRPAHRRSPMLERRLLPAGRLNRLAAPYHARQRQCPGELRH